MEDRIMVLLALLTVFYIVFTFVYIIPAHEQRRCKKLYDSVKVGDKYIRKLREPNPFEKQWGSVITITDKAMNKQGVPYVKYLDGYTEHSEDFSDMIEAYNYEPYNNQDKKQ